MKKFVLLLAAVVALSASAGNFTTNGIRPMPKNAVMHPERTVGTPTLKSPKAPMAMRETKLLANMLTSAVISSQPEGELKTYNRTGGAFTYTEGLAIGNQSGKAYVVFGEGNKVYLKDPVYGLKYGTWVEGTLSADGTTITVPLGQTIYAPAGYNYEMLLSWGSTTYVYQGSNQSVSIAFTKDNSVTEAVYTIDGDNIYLEGTEGDLDQDFPENCVTSGLCGTWSDDDTWQGCIDFGTTYTLTENVEGPTLITEQPEGELVQYYRGGEASYVSGSTLYFASQDGDMIDIVYGDNNKVYLKDPISHAKTGNWVEGTLSADGTTISVPLGQYLNWNDNEGYGLIIQKINLGISTQGSISATILPDNEVTYTIDGNTITMNDTYGDMNATFPSDFRGLAGMWSDDLTFSGRMDWNTVYTLPIAGPAIPADPSLDPEDTGYPDAWVDCGDEGGYSVLRYKINLVDVNGNPLDAEKVSYSIFTDDDQLFTFDAETYSSDFTEDVTEVPYNHNVYDVYSTAAFFYRTNAAGYDRFFNNRIGIQVYYTVDGVKNASNIVYYNLPTYPEYGVPANPTADSWYDEGNESGYSKFKYTIATTTTDGETMDPYRMFFSIFTDNDQLFTFDLNTYGWDFDEDVTMVPYTHSGMDVSKNITFFYRTNAEGYDRFFNHQIGIQVYYLQADNTLTASDIVYLEVFEPVAEQTAEPTIHAIPGEKMYTVSIDAPAEDPDAQIYYRVQINDGEWSEWMPYTDDVIFNAYGTYTIEAYAVADGKGESEIVSTGFTINENTTAVSEILGGKTVAGVRYFNMAGQEMSEANGICIAVTTYTDGTTSTVKVVK